MGKHLVLVGGGHAHMMTLAGMGRIVEKGHRVTVIGPSDHHYYSGMGPGMLGGSYKPEDIRFATRHGVESRGGRFVLGKALKVDPERKTVLLSSGEAIPYDVISFNAGSYVPTSQVAGDGRDIFPVKPIEQLWAARQRVVDLLSRGSVTVAIAGGGPSAAEIAGNLLQLAGAAKGGPLKVRIFAGSRFMARFPDAVRRRVARSLVGRGVDIVEQGYVEGVRTGEVALDTGRRHAADLIFLAFGVRPSRIFTDSGLPVGPDGGLRVNTRLQGVRHPDMFGGGDCIDFEKRPLDKVGVYAVRENPVLFHNLSAALDGAPLRHFDPGGGYLLVFNLGNGIGVLKKGRLVLGGRPAFWIKDYIDRRFMRRFQALE